MPHAESISPLELTFTVGSHVSDHQGDRREVYACSVGDVVTDLCDSLAEIGAGVETWVCPAVLDRHYAKGTNWRRSRMVFADVDFRDHQHEHAIVTPEAISRLGSLRDELPGNLFYSTPRGFRLVFVLAEWVAEKARMREVARLVAGLVGRWLNEEGLTRSDRIGGGFEVDRGATADVVGLFFLPNAKVGGHQRNAKLTVLRTAHYDAAELEPDIDVAPLADWEAMAGKAKGRASLLVDGKPLDKGKALEVQRELAEVEPIEAPGLEHLARILEKIPSDDRGEWIQVGFGLHHETKGSDDGAALFDAWSARSDKWKPGEPEEKWAGFGKHPKEKPITWATVVRLADHYGAKISLTEPEEIFDVEDVETSDPQSPGASPFAGPPARIDLKVEPPPVRALLLTPSGRPFMNRGRVGTLNATGGVGKTYVGLELAVAIAVRRRWLGRYEVEDDAPRRSLVAVAEETVEECWRRLHAICEVLELTDEERDAVVELVEVYALAGKPTPLMDKGGAGTTEHHAALKSRLDAGGPWSLVLLDPQARFVGMEVETTNEGATVFVQTALEPLTTAPGGPAVLMMGHSSKEAGRSGRADARGVTGQRDAYRWAALIYPDSERGAFIFEHDKTNYTGEDGLLRLRRLPCGLLRCAGLVDDAADRAAKDAKAIDKALAKEELAERKLDAAIERATPRVLAFIESNPGASARDVENAGGRKVTNKATATRAIERGYIEDRGDGGRHSYFITDSGKDALKTS